VLAAIYVLWAYQRVMTGQPNAEVSKMRDLNGIEIAAMAPVIVALVVVGCLPQLVIDPIQPEVVQLQVTLGVDIDPSVGTLAGDN
jgi:NADH-quinone oxidoreductase subunit M